MYDNTIRFELYMVFTNSNFNNDKFLNIRFSVKLLKLATHQK